MAISNNTSIAFNDYFSQKDTLNVETEEKTNRNMTLPRNMIISWAYLENQNKSTLEAEEANEWSQGGSGPVAPRY